MSGYGAHHWCIPLTSSVVFVLSEIQACGNLDAFNSIKTHLQKAPHIAPGSILHFLLSVRLKPVSTVRHSGFEIFNLSFKWIKQLPD